MVCSGILVPVFGVIYDEETPALLMSRGCDVLVAVSLVARCVFYSHTTPSRSFIYSYAG